MQLLITYKDKLFEKFFVIISQKDWDKNFSSIKVTETPQTEEESAARLIRKYWFNWTICDPATTLRDIDEKYPDEVTFCGTTLGVLVEANKVLGSEDIYTPEEMVVFFKE